MHIKNLFLLLLIVYLLPGCKKQSPAEIDTVTGSWDIKKIEGLNGNNNYTGLDFVAGKLSFMENGILQFSPVTQELYTGTWHLTEIKYDDNCYTYPDGHEVCDQITNLTLNIAVEKLFCRGRTTS